RSTYAPIGRPSSAQGRYDTAASRLTATGARVIDTTSSGSATWRIPSPRFASAAEPMTRRPPDPDPDMMRSGVEGRDWPAPLPERQDLVPAAEPDREPGVGELPEQLPGRGDGDVGDPGRQGLEPAGPGAVHQYPAVRAAGPQVADADEARPPAVGAQPEP